MTRTCRTHEELEYLIGAVQGQDCLHAFRTLRVNAERTAIGSCMPPYRGTPQGEHYWLGVERLLRDNLELPQTLIDRDEDVLIGLIGEDVRLRDGRTGTMEDYEEDEDDAWADITVRGSDGESFPARLYYQPGQTSNQDVVSLLGHVERPSNDCLVFTAEDANDLVGCTVRIRDGRTVTLSSVTVRMGGYTTYNTVADGVVDSAHARRSVPRGASRCFNDIAEIISRPSDIEPVPGVFPSSTTMTGDRVILVDLSVVTLGRRLSVGNHYDRYEVASDDGGEVRVLTSAARARADTGNLPLPFIGSFVARVLDNASVVPVPTVSTPLTTSRRYAFDMEGKVVLCVNGETYRLATMQIEGGNWAVYKVEGEDNADVRVNVVHGHTPSGLHLPFCVTRVLEQDALPPETLPEMTDEEITTVVTAHALGQPIQCKRIGTNWATATHLLLMSFDFAMYLYRIDPALERKWWKVANRMSISKRNNKVSLQLDATSAHAIWSALVVAADVNSTQGTDHQRIVLTRAVRMLGGYVANPQTRPFTSEGREAMDIVEHEFEARVDGGARDFVHPNGLFMSHAPTE